MTGRQILDAMYILKASRSVLAKHIGLRRRQLDVYSKTSSLAKAIKNQTSKFPFTARTISNLADQVKNSRGSGLSSPTGSQVAPKHAPQMTRSAHVQAKDTTSTESISGRERDQFDTQPGANLSTDHIPGEKPGTTLEDVQRSPIPNEFVMSAPNESVLSAPNESVLSAKDEKPSSSRGRDTFSDRSLADSQHNSLADSDGKSDESLQPSSTNRTSIPTPSTHGSPMEPDRARKLQRLAENQVPSTSAEAHPPSETQTTTSNHKLEELDTNKQQDVFFTRPVSISPTFSSLPRVKLPTTTTSTQDGIENLSDTDINQDVYYSARPAKSSVPDAQALSEQGQPSDVMYSELFHSPRVAKLLKREDERGGFQDQYLKNRKLPHETDKESLSGVPPTSPETADLLEKKNAENTRHLAEDISNDSTSASSTGSEVSFWLHFTRNHILMN